MVIFHAVSGSFSSVPQKGQRVELFLPPSELDYLVWPVAKLPQRRREQAAFFKWVAVKELLFTDPAVCWKLENGCALIAACERATLTSWQARIEGFGATLARVDGLLTPILNSAAGKSSVRTLVVLSHDFTVLAGIDQGYAKFVRRFRLPDQDSLHREITATMSYYDFSPEERLFYSFGSSRIGEIDLRDAGNMGKILHE